MSTFPPLYLFYCFYSYYTNTPCWWPAEKKDHLTGQIRVNLKGGVVSERQTHQVGDSGLAGRTEKEQLQGKKHKKKRPMV